MTKKNSPELDQYINKLEEWITERKKALDYSLEQFDKLIITLSSGALILTVGFVRDIVKISANTNTFLLKCSWYLMALALVFSLLSQISAYLSNRFEIDYTRIEIKNLMEFGTFEKKGFKIKLLALFKNYVNKITVILNVLSLVVLISGIAAFIKFINQNL
jgi:hypothetical protein